MTVPDDQQYSNCVYLMLMAGRLMSSHQTAYKGINHIELNVPAGLQTGMYVLQVFYRDQMITKADYKKD